MVSPPATARPAGNLGLDAAGVVAEVGERVHDIVVGERVYVNPLRGCGSCRKALAPSRIEVFSTRSGSVADWSKRLTGGEGVDVAIDSLAAGAPPAATLDALWSVRKGGRMVIIGGVSGDVPVNVKWLMDNSIQLIGSLWFSTAEGQEIADMAAAGTLDLSIFQPKMFPLSQVNDLIKRIGDREGGFTNFVVVP